MKKRRPFDFVRCYRTADGTVHLGSLKFRHDAGLNMIDGDAIGYFNAAARTFAEAYNTWAAGRNDEANEARARGAVTTIRKAIALDRHTRREQAQS